MFKKVLIAAFVFLLVACDSTPPLSDNSSVACNFDNDNMLKVSASVPTLSAIELTDVCTEIEHSLGHAPNFILLRKLGQDISLIQSKGVQTTPKDLAYQMLIITEKRGQLNDEKAMINTFDILWKISGGTNGRVTPKDMIEGIRGINATKLSDDGLINIGAMISTYKRDRGE